MVLPRIPNYTIRTAYTPKNLFLVIRAKKKKKRERATGGASEPNILLTYNHHLWYALFPLYEVLTLTPI